MSWSSSAPSWGNGLAQQVDHYTGVSARASGGQGGRPLAANTVRGVHAILHAGFAQAVRWDVIASSPADSASPPASRKPKIEPPTPDGLSDALAAVGSDPPLALFLRLAAMTGGRRGQLCALRWTDIDLEAATITFARAVVDVAGEGPVEKST
ncbi:MAG: hypothetical protein HRT86_15130, partial [Ilumatobacteraceae bacterium]|nr:hypothetical protein [Ilumatobacteraceae bacterium]